MSETINVKGGESIEILNKRKHPDRNMKSLLDIIDNAAIEINEEGRITFVNLSCLELFVFEDAEVSGKDFDSIFSFSYKNESLKLVDLVNLLKKENAEKIKLHEVRCNAISGYSFIIDINFTNTRYTDENESGYLILLKDITRQIEQKNRIAALERKFFQAQDFGKMGTWMVSLDTLKVTASAEAFKIYELDSSVEHSMTHIQEPVVAEYREALDEAFVNLIQYGTPYDVTFEIVTALTQQRKTIQSIAEYNKEQNQVSGIIRDITDYPVILPQRFKTELNYKEIIENYPYPIVFTSLDRRIISCNQAFLNDFGYSIDEIRGKKTSFLYASHDDWLDLEQDLSLSLIEEQKEKEIKLLSKQGKEIWCKREMSYIKNMYDDIAGYTVALRDVTKEMEELERTRDVFHAHSAAMLVIEPMSGFIVNCNKTAVSYYGYSERELNMMRLEELTYSDKHKIVKRIQECILRGRNHYESTQIDKKGRLKPVELFLTKVKIDGRYYVHAIVYDVSEKKKAEEQIKLLQTAVDQSPVTIVITNTEGLIQYANPVFEKTTGYKLAEVLGKRLTLLKSGYHTKDYYDELWDTILSGSSWQGEFKNKRKNGELYWEEAIISPIKNTEGEITHFLAIKEDITRRKKMIKELKTAKEKAEDSDRLKSAFLANVSHEVRTPMNGIIGFTELLQNDSDDDSMANQYAEYILQSAHQLMGTFDSVIDLALIESQQIDVAESKVDVIRMINNMIPNYIKICGKKPINITKRINLSDEYRAIITDITKLKRVFDYVLKNAIKFTEEGEIEVSCVKHDDMIEFCVKDTGIGIPEEKMEKIFNAFEQTNTGTTRNYEGLGVGLTVSKAFVEALGGKLWVESEVGVGSSFFIAIPVK
ncbi:PAS domain S-box protein [Puteibacter caeruleilacunae]|nr:PAS domain S-box protein [Puteibacter caeruleilacunae]